ncbi:hypothetical protein ABFS83_08G139200 [Erythranthe nasuta]
MMVLGEAKPKLERKYSVRISARALKSFDSMLIPEDTAPQDLLEGACKMVMENFRNYAHNLDSKFNEKAYELRRAIVELVELYRSGHPDSKFWVARLRGERDSASLYMNWLLYTWDFGLDGTLNLETVAKLKLLNESTLDEPSPFKEASDVARFLDDVQDQLLYRFRSLLTVDDRHVHEVLSKLTDVPLTQIVTSVDNHYKKMAISMTNNRVVDQKRVINEIFETLASERRTTMRPMGSFLLLGPSRVGKKEIAKAVARHWYCDESRLVEIDMAEYVEPPVESAEGSKRIRRYVWNQLIDAVKKRPYSVIVLDKIDKASSSVITDLLKVLTCGATSDFEGRTVDFSKSIIFVTSSVGSDQIELPCTCYDDLPKQSRPKILEFHMAHRCPLKYNVTERVINEAKETLSSDLIGSLDKVLVVKRFRNQRAVGRLILRETVKEVYGERLVVHASNEAINSLFSKALTLYLKDGKTFRQVLLEDVIPQIPDTTEILNVCVDTLAGTRQFSFRFQTHGQNAGDCYFKLKDGTFDNFTAELKARVEAACRLFDLRSECLRLFQSDQSLYELKKLVLDARNEFETCYKYQDTETLLSCIFKKITSCKGKLPKEEEKERFKKHRIELKGKNSGIAKATRTILGALMETSDDASLKSRNLPPRHYFFVGLNDDAKAGLISSLNRFLGELFFVYVKLDNNSRGEEVKEFLVDQVRLRPCLVVMLDGVEFADEVLYTSLLEILDKGTVDDSVEFRRTILILTSNAENKWFIAVSAMFNHRRDLISEIAMNQNQNQKRFRTELLYRVKRVVFFDPLSEHGGVPFKREHGVKYKKPLDEIWLSSCFYSAFVR